MPKKPLVEETEEDHGTVVPEPDEVGSLVGSGTPMVTVRANVGCLGLAYGQQQTLVRTAEVEANIANGNVSVVES